jgi:hypothetical protein
MHSCHSKPYCGIVCIVYTVLQCAFRVSVSVLCSVIQQALHYIIAYIALCMRYYLMLELCAISSTNYIAHLQNSWILLATEQSINCMSERFLVRARTCTTRTLWNAEMRTVGGKSFSHSGLCDHLCHFVSSLKSKAATTRGRHSASLLNAAFLLLQSVLVVRITEDDGMAHMI